MSGKLTNRLFAPMDIASLVVFRILFGAIMFWEVCRYFENEWIRRYFIEPTFYFTYYGFGWVHPWPGNGMYYHFAVLGLLAAFITVGLFYRLSIVLFFLGFTYIFLLDQTNYLNHFYFVSLISFLLIFTPAHRAASLDAWLRPRLRSETVPAWPLFMLTAQVAILYIGAGIAKIDEDFILHGEPMRMWLADRTDMTLLGPLLPVGKLFTREWVVFFFSYAGLCFDLLVVPALLWRRTRPFAFAVAVVFHLMNATLFSIGIFPWFSMAATTLFFDPGWPRRVLNWPRKAAASFMLPVGEPAPPRGRVLAFIGIYVTAQVFMPLRHFLYPGDVNWTEEGHRFSWHMKLRDKDGRATFNVRDPQTDETWTVNPREYLTQRQAEKMSRRTDMLLQFAHFLADKFRLERGHDVEVRAEARVSLNNRPPQFLVDPEVNLATEKRTLWPAPWILPLSVDEPLPAETATPEE